MPEHSLPPRPGEKKAIRPIVLTSHPRAGAVAHNAPEWGAADPRLRGPVVATLTDPGHRNSIGTHAGAYSLYRALAIAAGQLAAGHRPDLTDTRPGRADRPVSRMERPGSDRLARSVGPPGDRSLRRAASRAGWDIRPDHRGHARAYRHAGDRRRRMRAGRLTADGSVLTERGEVRVTKIADRAGLVAARRRRALRDHRDRAAPHACSSRPAACSPSW